jgi:uncharacterized RDD family membrane protein YckC
MQRTGFATYNPMHNLESVMTDLINYLIMLKSPKADTRCKACEELRVATESSPEVVLALEEATQDEDEYVAESARQALTADVHNRMALKMGRSWANPAYETVNQSIGADEIAATEEVMPSYSPPASLFRRFGALFIDMLILAIICIGIGLLFGSLLEIMRFYTRLISAAIALLYFSFGNSIHFEGNTLGKRALHLCVKGLDETYISFPRALLRSSILVILVLFSGWQLPISSADRLPNTIIGIVIVGLVGAIIYLALFNRKTGQNLDDLIAGTRVVFSNGTRIQAYPATPRKHRIGAGATAIVLILVAFGINEWIMAVPAINSSLQTLMPLYTALNQDGRFYQVGVSSRYQQMTGEQPVNFLLITLWPKANLDDLERQKITQDAVGLAQKYFSTADFDAVQVHLTSGYDLGFIKNTVVWLCDPTQGCRYKVVNHNILRLFNFNMTYETK